MIGVLSNYNYPEEFADQKAFKDIKEVFGLIYFKDNPALKAILNALTPNKIEDFIRL